MKKKLVVLGMITALLFTGCSSKDGINDEKKESNIRIENPDFRNCKWGITKEEVKKCETYTEIVTEDDNGFMTSSEIDNNNVYIAYLFNNNKMYACVVILNEEHTNRNLYIDDYENFQELIKEKYGEPKTDDKNWKNDLYKDNPDDWGDAIAYGHLTMISQWITDTTEVGLMLSGDNYEINLQIIYQDLNYEEEVDTSGI